MIVHLGAPEVKAAMRRYEQDGRVPSPAVRQQLVAHADELQRELERTRSILKAASEKSKTSRRRSRRKLRRIPR